MHGRSRMAVDPCIPGDAGAEHVGVFITERGGISQHPARASDPCGFLLLLLSLLFCGYSVRCLLLLPVLGVGVGVVVLVPLLRRTFPR